MTMSSSRVSLSAGMPPILPHRCREGTGPSHSASQTHGHSREGGTRRQPSSRRWRSAAWWRRVCSPRRPRSWPSDPSAPPARADALVRFADCDALRAWYVDHTIDQVGPWGWGGAGRADDAPRTLARTPSFRRRLGQGGRPTGRPAPTPRRPTSTSPTSRRPTVGSSYACGTGGELVDHRRHRQPSRGSSRSGGCPASAYADALLLVGDHVLLTGQRASARWDVRATSPAGRRQHRRCTTSTSPTRLTRDSTGTPPGPGSSSRCGSTATRCAWSPRSACPQLRFVQPRRGQRSASDQAERRNREIVRSSRIEDWIPGLSCERRLPPARPGRDPTRWRCGPSDRVRWPTPPQVAVTGAGSEVYSSADRLYVTSTDWGSRPILRGEPTRRRGRDQLDRSQRPTTYIHAFALDGDTHPLRRLRVGQRDRPDRWSLDEHDGHLRVAVSWPDQRARASGTTGSWCSTSTTGKLEQVGCPPRPRDRRADPVGALVRRPGRPGDLPPDRPALHHRPRATRPSPRAAGRAEDPRLLLLPAPDRRRPAPRPRQRRHARPASSSVPRPRSSTSPTPAHVRQVGKVTFGQNSWLEAADDPHAFTWLPDGPRSDHQRAGRDRRRVDGAAARRRPTDRLASHDLGSVGGWAPAGPPARGRPGGAGRRPGADRRPRLRPAIVAVYAEAARMRVAVSRTLDRESTEASTRSV